MPAYDLLDRQKECLRQLVEAYQKSRVSGFNYSLTSMWEGVWFDKAGIERIQFAAECDDLLVLESEGLIMLRRGSDGEIVAGSVRQSGVDAVGNNFLRPIAAGPAGVVYQTFYAPVGAVNAGDGKIEIETQHVGMSAGDIGSLFSELRALIVSLPSDGQTEAAESLTDLESELRSAVPKQNRIKAFLLSLWAIGNEAVGFATKLTLLAQAYGIDIHHSKP